MDNKLFLFCSCIVVAALITGSAALTDNDKHVFVFAFMNISLDDPNLPVYQEIFLGTMWNQSHFRMEVPKIGTDFRDEVRYKDPIVPQFVEQVTSRNLNDDDALTTQTVFNALRVTADHRINIQAAKTTQGSTDGMLVLPLTANSKEFFIPSFDNFPLGHSTFLIVSPYKDTYVEASYVNGTDVRRIFFRSLGEFEVFQTYSEIEDYTGVFVSATRPIAVLGGHVCSQIPVVKRFCDHIVEQVPPIDEWGWQFVMGPIIGRQYQAGYTIRVIAGYMNTTIDVITHNGGTDSYFKHRGDFITVDILDARSIVTVMCSEKCLVAQYNKGYLAYSHVDTVTDPFMTLITPNDHMTNRMTFTTARLLDTMGTVPFINYLTVVAPMAAASGIILNDRPIATVFGNTTSWTTGVDGQWAVVSFGVDPDNYTMYHPDDNVKFVGYLYGHGGVKPTGYGYATGYAMHGDPVPEEDFDFTFTTEPPVVTVAPGTCSTNRPFPPDSLHPDRGPLAGGTVITLLGNCLQSPYPVTAVNIGDDYLATVQFCNDTYLEAITSVGMETDVNRKLRIRLVFQDQRIISVDDHVTFTYRSNPTIRDINPLLTVLEGGIFLTVSGSSLDSVWRPYLEVTTNIRRFLTAGQNSDFNVTNIQSSEICELVNISSETSLLCPTPPSDIPDDILGTTGKSSQGDADSAIVTYDTDLAVVTLYIGFKFDGYKAYTNISNVTDEALAAKGVLEIVVTPYFNVTLEAEHSERTPLHIPASIDNKPS